MTRQQFLIAHPECNDFARSHPIRFIQAYLTGKVMAELILFPKTIEIWRLRFYIWRLNRKITKITKQLKCNT